MNKIQWFVLSGAVLIFVLLFFLPKTNPDVEDAVKRTQAGLSTGGHELESHIADFKKDLQAGEAEIIHAVERSLELAENEQRLLLLDSLIKLWDKNKEPVGAAIYALQKAEEFSSAGNWFDAAERLFYSARFSEEHLASHVYAQAIRSYNEVLKAWPDSMDAKINLAVCYVESSTEPMRGIALLREVLSADSLNVKAHLNLGYFSLKSGQYEKAISRFLKVIEIDPAYVEAFLYLGDIYETKGDKAKAIEYYERYQAEVKNPALSREIESYIEKLKTNNTN